MSKKSENPDFRTSRTRSLSHGSGSNSANDRPPSSRFQRGITREDATPFRGTLLRNRRSDCAILAKIRIFRTLYPPQHFYPADKNGLGGCAGRVSGSCITWCRSFSVTSSGLGVGGGKLPFWDFGASPLAPYGSLTPGTSAIFISGPSHASVPNLVKIRR